MFKKMIMSPLMMTITYKNYPLFASSALSSQTGACSKTIIPAPTYGICQLEDFGLEALSGQQLHHQQQQQKLYMEASHDETLFEIEKDIRCTFKVKQRDLEQYFQTEPAAETMHSLRDSFNLLRTKMPLQQRSTLFGNSMRQTSQQVRQQQQQPQLQQPQRQRLEQQFQKLLQLLHVHEPNFPRHNRQSGHVQVRQLQGRQIFHQPEQPLHEQQLQEQIQHHEAPLQLADQAAPKPQSQLDDDIRRAIKAEVKKEMKELRDAMYQDLRNVILVEVQKLSREVRELARKIKELDQNDPFRVESSSQILEKLHMLGLTATRDGLELCDNVSASSFCRRRLPVIMQKLKMTENIKMATKLIQQGHVRVGIEVVKDPAFLVSRNLEDFVTWVDTSAIRKHILEYNEMRDDFDFYG